MKTLDFIRNTKRMVYDLYHVGGETHIFSGSTNSYPVRWGKCVIHEKDNTVEIMQSPVSCKDYVVDTRYRRITSGYDSSNWKQKEIEYPAIYIWTNKSNYDKILQNLKEVLNPWEEKNNFQPSEVFEINFGNTKAEHTEASKLNRYFVFKFDPQFMINAMNMSVYLSIVRHTLIQGKLDFGKKTTDVSQEYNYYKRETFLPIFREVLDWTIQNPQALIEFTKDCTVDGYSTHRDQHGCTGIFYIYSYLYYKYSTFSHHVSVWSEFEKQFKDYPLIKYIEHVMEILKKEKEVTIHNVKMQSLQPKTPRARTSTKTPTNHIPQTTTDMYAGVF